jgi:hypothetical protein
VASIATWWDVVGPSAVVNTAARDRRAPARETIVSGVGPAAVEVGHTAWAVSQQRSALERGLGQPDAPRRRSRPASQRD